MNRGPIFAIELIYTVDLSLFLVVSSLLIYIYAIMRLLIKFHRRLHNRYRDRPLIKKKTSESYNLHSIC